MDSKIKNKNDFTVCENFGIVAKGAIREIFSFFFIYIYIELNNKMLDITVEIVNPF
jgi:hypothetical protein